LKRIARLLPLVAFAVALGSASLPAGAAPSGAASDSMKQLYSKGTGFTHSDLAFWGKYAYQGHYGGIRVFDIGDPTRPKLVADVPCYGPQNDVSVWRGVLITSTDRTLTGSACGSGNAAHDDPNGWEGLRIWDVSNPLQPVHVNSVYQDCGSHTNTIYPTQDGKSLLVYNQSYPLRPGPTCGPDNGPPNGQDPLHGKIQIVKVLISNPKKASEVAEPAVNYPGDPDNLFDPQEHGLPDFAGPPTPTNRLNDMRACHDVSFLLGNVPHVNAPYGIAGAACAEQAQLWRINRNGLPDTANPIWVYDDNEDETGITGDPADPGVAVDFWHTMTFTWDGRFANLNDESFADDCPPTTEAFGADTGRSFLVNLRTGNLRSHFMIPRPEEGAYCSTHQGAFVPDNDNYYLVQAWYMGGAGVVDWTDPLNPQEVAFWDFNPAGATGSDNWSHYWYEGPLMPGPGIATYGQDGVHNPPTGRGFQVFRTNLGDEADVNLTRLNPQVQEGILFGRFAP